MRPPIGRGFGLGEQRLALLVGGQHRIDEALRAVGRFLRDAAHFRRFRPGQAAVIGRDLARQHPQQRGLAGAVAADDAHLMAIRDGGRGLVEKQAAFDAIGEVVNVQHWSRTW